ncbi:hypothetical protein CHU98_g11739 [Xylaria longipes]|nr:hypothetical protein CHU98_g11739 [Xylaria longipes]
MCQTSAVSIQESHYLGVDRLWRKLRDTRLPNHSSPSSRRRFGPRLPDWIHKLYNYWCMPFDWSAAQRKISHWRHHGTEIKGPMVHFVHQPAPTQHEHREIPLPLTTGIVVWVSEKYYELVDSKYRDLDDLCTTLCVLEGCGHDGELSMVSGYTSGLHGEGEKIENASRVFHQRVSLPRFVLSALRFPVRSVLQAGNVASYLHAGAFWVSINAAFNAI